MRCKKYNDQIIQNNFGTLPNEDLKIIENWSYVSVIEGQATFGEDQATVVVHEVDPNMIPIDLFMDGYIPFYNMVIFKEEFYTLWCCFCKVFRENCQQYGHKPGDPYTIEKLI